MRSCNLKDILVFKIIFIFFLLIIDFSSKKIIFDLINLNNFIPVVFFMDIAHIHNFGVSFGLFAGIIPSIYLVIIGIAVTSLVFYLYIQSKKKLEKWGYILIIAGALSNILDRFINGYVIDFIYIHYKEFYWPAFNFADIYISIGISLLILNLFKNLLIKNDT